MLTVPSPLSAITALCAHRSLRARSTISCRHNAYWFMRTLFQSFGEFFLEELDNDASVIFLIITFLVLNIVLMNLLIAM